MIQLESLANELLFDLFEYFHSIDLLRSFSQLNTRFNHLLSSYFRCHQLNLQSISKEDCDHLCAEHLPLFINHISSLVLLDDDDDDETPSICELLQSHGFYLNDFIHLQSLSLSNMYSCKILDDLIYQCRSLPFLTHLNIIRNPNNGKRIARNIVHLFDNIWNLTRLRSCNVDGIYTEDISLWNISTISSSIVDMSIKYIPCSLTCLSHLIKLTPSLRRLSTTIFSYSFDDRLSFILTSIQCLKVVYGGSLDALCHLFENLPNLSHLIITTSQLYLDGNLWKDLLKSYLSKVKRFQMKMEFDYRENNNNEIEDLVDELLLSYQSSFWLEEHQWYVRCHWNSSDPYKSITLYTLPYYFSSFNYINKSLTKSTSSPLRCYSYNHVQRFDHGNMEMNNNNNSFDSLTFANIYFDQIHSLHINLPFDNHFWLCFRSFLHLTSLYVYIYKYSSYHQLQTLLHHSSNLYSFKLRCYFHSSIEFFVQLTSSSIRRLDLMDMIMMNDRSVIYLYNSSFFIHSSLMIQCEVLFIHIQCRNNVIDIITKLSHLRLLIFTCQDDNDDDDDDDGNRNEEKKKKVLCLKDELVEWLKDHLPSTYVIRRYPWCLSRVSIWINRETMKKKKEKERIVEDNSMLRLSYRSKLTKVLRSFRQWFA